MRDEANAANQILDNKGIATISHLRTSLLCGCVLSLPAHKGSSLSLRIYRTLTLAQSSPYTVTADNQCAVDIGIFVYQTVESSFQKWWFIAKKIDLVISFNLLYTSPTVLFPYWVSSMNEATTPFHWANDDFDTTRQNVHDWSCKQLNRPVAPAPPNPPPPLLGLLQIHPKPATPRVNTVRPKHSGQTAVRNDPLKIQDMASKVAGLSRKNRDARQDSLVYILASDVCSLAAASESDQYYATIGSTGFATCFTAMGASVAERLDCSPPTKANQVESQDGSLPDFSKWESCQTMPLVGGFSRDFPFSPPLHSDAVPYSQLNSYDEEQSNSVGESRLEEVRGWGDEVVAPLLTTTWCVPGGGAGLGHLAGRHLASIRLPTPLAFLITAAVTPNLPLSAERSPLATMTQLCLRALENTGIVGRLPASRLGESCRTMPLVGGFSRGSTVAPSFHSGTAPPSPQLTHIGSQYSLITPRVPLGVSSVARTNRTMVSGDAETNTTDIAVVEKISSSLFNPVYSVRGGIIWKQNFSRASGKCGVTVNGIFLYVESSKIFSLSYALLHHRGSKLDPRSVLRSKQKTVAPFEFRAGLRIEMKTEINVSKIQNHEISLVKHFFIGTKIKLDPGSKLGSFDLGSGKMLVQPGISNTEQYDVIIRQQVVANQRAAQSTGKLPLRAAANQTQGAFAEPRRAYQCTSTPDIKLLIPGDEWLEKTVIMNHRTELLPSQRAVAPETSYVISLLRRHCDKITVQHVYIDVTFVIGSLFIRQSLYYSEPIVDFREFNDLHARLHSLMYKYADINCALAVGCNGGRRRLGQLSPGGVKHCVGQSSIHSRHYRSLIGRCDQVRPLYRIVKHPRYCLLLITGSQLNETCLNNRRPITMEGEKNNLNNWRTVFLSALRTFFSSVCASYGELPSVSAPEPDPTVINSSNATSHLLSQLV
ncbi:hypothetical protein PR048_022754 [Dryococelus australis]|uniref:Uncharacterized protein n=1 Tax=Dryococelus australis TaxID=614101 RepID=A0ABQ9GS53_9NEOP|nr:hypothetical protein PR048_022754 [Dryococelus australis]